MKNNLITKFLGIVVLGLLLTGCFATTGKFEETLDSWVGGSEDELVSSWGAPNGVYDKNDGGKVLTYFRSHQSTFEGTTSTKTTYDSSGYATTTTSTTPGTDITLTCKTTFVVSSTGRITSWSYQGNNCKAR